MAKLSAHDQEIIRFFSPARFMLKAYMADGKILGRTVFSGGWKVVGRLKPGVTPQQAAENIRQWQATQPAWVAKVKSFPSQCTLEQWISDGGCETPSGDWVEPDGEGPDGAPSWLRLLGCI